ADTFVHRCLSHANDLDSPHDFLSRNQFSLSRSGTALLGFLPGLRRLDGAFPKRPGLALARPRCVNRAAGFPIPKNAIAIGSFAQAALSLDEAGIQPLDFASLFSAEFCNIRYFLVVDPNETRRPGTTIAAASALESKAFGIPWLGHRAFSARSEF